VIGDESALPAIATVLAVLPEGLQARVFVEVADPAEEQPLATGERTELRWLHRGAARPGRPLVEAVREAGPPDRVAAVDCQAWVSAESAAVREIRAFLLDECGLVRRRVYATGYWRAR
jgi:NADPH-dependent ferric siderophore reductase